MIILYHIFTTALLLVLLPVIPVVWVISEKRRANLFQRLGLFTGILRPKNGEYRIWVHALSVGEVNSALPFVNGLKKRKPGAKILFTASTRTGFETAQALMSPEKEGSPVSGLGYFPFDVWLCVLAVMFRIRPDLVCLVETDLWPGFLSIMRFFKVPVVLVNARLSPRSLKGYRRLGRFSALFFSGLTHVMAQTQRDAAGFETLGIFQDRLSVTGNMKFDRPFKGITKEARKRLEEKLGIQTGQKVWIAGSTHQGEESVVVDVFRKLRMNFPGLKLIIAPRDPKRTRQLLRDLALESYAAACFSDTGPEKKRADILFMDTLGELAEAYAVCDFAFIGGSLVKQGGHNPLEPAMFGKPVFFGPQMTDFREIERLLVEQGGARRVGGGEQMMEMAVSLLSDTEACTAMGQAAKTVFQTNSGALRRILDKLDGDFLV